MIMSGILLLAAPVMFDARIPSNILVYLVKLAFFLVVSLALACVLGLSVKSQAKLTMLCQVAFLPSILLSGIMFPAELLPDFLEQAGRIFPAYWGYRLLAGMGSWSENTFSMILIFLVTVILAVFFVRRQDV